MSSKDIAVSVRGLSKAYTIDHNEERHVTLAETVLSRLKNPLKRPRRETFWALSDVSFDIRKGDVVGIIGRNGAGKSTLLKILSRITEPTKGEIEIRGRIGSLLEVGTGFHPELTGRENVFLNGAILGMSKGEIKKQFDAIVDFAGVEKFLDTPVKRYSSGMYVRLAFAVAAHLRTEILVVDEVLSVGDAEFQRKCLGKMKDVASGGRTVLFVSHNMAAVANLCSSALALRAGGILCQGETLQAVRRYSETMQSEGSKTELRKCRPSWALPLIQEIAMLDQRGHRLSRLPMGAYLAIEMTFKVRPSSPLRSPVMGVVFNHATSGPVAGVNTRMTGFSPDGGAYTAGTMRCVLPRLPFLQGRYTVDVWLGESVADLDAILGYLTLDIEDSDVYGSGKPPFSFLGNVFLEPRWELANARTERRNGAVQANV